MKHIVFFITLALVPALAFAQISPVGPDSLAAPFATAGDTRTFIRCYYRLDDDSRKPATAYHWAIDAFGAYYSLPGRWAYPDVLNVSNVFLTDVRRAEIERICHGTLQRKADGRPLQMTVAADTRVSFDYEIWSNDVESDDDTPSRVISFGDSLTDTHNMYNLSLWKAPNATTWFNGAFSNGPIWIQVVASETGLTLVNWASGGAGADTYIVLPGVLQQVRSWIDLHKRVANYRSDRTIYTLLVGSNDLYNYGRSPEESLAIQRQAVDELIDDGATKIMLMNLPDVTRTPGYWLRKDTAVIAQKTKAFNAGMALMHAALVSRYAGKVHIELFDTHEAINDIIANPSAYGIENTAEACVDIRVEGTLAYLFSHPINAACMDADRYMFWDQSHPTRRTHRVIGEAVARVIVEEFF